MNLLPSKSWSGSASTHKPTFTPPSKPKMASTPDDSDQLATTALGDHQLLLNRIAAHAERIVSTEKDSDRRVHLLRLYAEEIGCPVSEKAAGGFIARAAGRRVGIGTPILPGQAMSRRPMPWAWDGVILANRFNLLVAPPKVGKSALTVGLIGAWHSGESSYLGRPIYGACPPVFIVGTDQPECDWITLFEREGLMDGDALGGPIQALWHSGEPLYLNDEGITALAELAAEHPGALFLLDSYHACVSPLGIDEATSAFDGPARELATALAPYDATLVMIHHTNKSVSGGNATSASRGSNALPAAASLTILMNWLKQPAEGQTQTDLRVVVKSQGRARGTTLLIELTDDGWVAHGDGDTALQAEALADAADDLQGRQADVFDYIAERWVNVAAPVSVAEVGSEFNLNGAKVRRHLSALVRKGLIQKVGQTPSTVLGGRPADLYAPVTTPSPEKVGETGETDLTPSRVHEKRGLAPLAPLAHLPGGGGFSPPPVGTPVERLIDGAWHNGWVVHDASNPHAVTIAKLGQSAYRIRNLRWDVDLRPCEGSPFVNPKSEEVEAPSLQPSARSDAQPETQQPFDTDW